MSILLRTVTPTDAGRLAEIYRPYVEGHSVTLEYDAPDAAEFERRIADIAGEFPYLAAVEDDRIIGYAYAHRYKQRYGYRFCAELSVYLEAGHGGKGLGRRLYGALIELCAMLGYKNLYGIVTDPNPSSFALHKHFGFTEAGREHLAGYKFGEWHDVVLFERIISPHESCADAASWRDAPLRFDALDAADIAAVLE